MVFDDGEKIQFNFRELCAFSTPPDFSVLTPVTPDAEAAQLLAVTEGSCAGRLPQPADTDTIADFRLEKEDYTFISVFFLTTTEPFIGAYILEDDFYHDLRMMSYDDLAVEKGVHFTPMPELHRWIAASSITEVGSSDARAGRLAMRVAMASSRNQD